jgi:O-antigen/teichoic acid export membrane protein
LFIKHHLSRKNIIWGFIAQGLGIGLWLALLPIALRYLPAKEVSLLMVFITISNLVQLIELGFQPTLTRNISYAYAGARSLSAVGINSVAKAGGLPNISLLHELLIAAKRIYFYIGLFALIVSWFGGTIYLNGIISKTGNFYEYIIAWILFSTGYIISLNFGYLNSFLQGRGDMLNFNRAMVFSRFIQLALSAISLVYGYGLIGVGLSLLIASILGRVLMNRYALVDKIKYESKDYVSPDKVKIIIRILWHNSSRYGLAMLGAFLISRACILVATSRLGLLEASGFVLALQILLSLQSLSTLPFSLTLPSLNLMKSQGEGKKMTSLFALTLVSSLLIFIISSVALVLIGNNILVFLGSSTKLPNTTILIFLCLILLLELNHGICANLITTSNKVPFVRGALVTGFFILIGSWLIAPEFGVIGIILVMGLTQLLYNNWKWPYEACEMLKINYIKLIINGFKEFTASIYSNNKNRLDNL